MSNFFNKDFFPTGRSVIEIMAEGLDLFDKVVFEPEAGKGNIVDYCTEKGAHVIACELNADLAKIVSQKCQFIKPDVFDVKAEEISHINYVFMNPPFSADEKHILHVYDIMPEGCELISLCNNETINNAFSTDRKKLVELIKNNGSSKKLGSMFEDAERKTKVVIGLIKLKKPKTDSDPEFDGYFDMSEEMEFQSNGIMTYSKVQDIVSRYVGSVKLWDKIQPIAAEINALISPINSNLGIGFGAHWTDSNKHYSSLDRAIFKKELQKSAWRSIFVEMKMEKYVTSGVMADINKFVEQQQSVPFTVKNIYLMLQMIVGTHSQRMDRVLVEAFDHICSLSADNSTAGGKWKTNSNYKVNQKFISNYMTEVGWGGEMSIRYDADNKLNDIVKALCFLTGKKYEDQNTLRNWFGYAFKIKVDGKILSGYKNSSSRKDDYTFLQMVEQYKKTSQIVEIFEVKRTFGEWHEWNEFFRVRGYKKNTMHFQFVDEKVWMQFNMAVAKIKGWQLPQKTDSKKRKN
ncbi:MAG TPA: DNA methyltransferase [Flavobacterium sp.]|nr:DNA methyltransferase [Flavobacterium sp.]